MKLIHLADLHIGKRVNEYSMIEDQQYILKRIMNIVDEEKPDGVLIAGDVYDKTVPSEEAVDVLDGFLTSLARRSVPVFIISGNHDSAVKLSFARELIDLSGIHIAPSFDGSIHKHALSSKDVQVNIYLMPFVNPKIVRAVYKDEEIKTYTQACQAVIDRMSVNKDEINILVAHQLVTGAQRCDSEDISVGGLDNIDYDVFDDFDYVALGHIHGPQKIVRDTVRYSGTPLKYSFSEKDHHKSVTVVEINGKDIIDIRTVPLIPLHDMREIRGTYEQLTSKQSYEGSDVDDYLQVVLTDEDDVPDALARLRIIYKNIMILKYDNARSRSNAVLSEGADVENKTPLELFAEFYQHQNNQPMNDEQTKFISELIEEIWKGGDQA